MIPYEEYMYVASHDAIHEWVVSVRVGICIMEILCAVTT